MVSTTQEQDQRGGFIAGPWFDIVFFILSPLVALVVAQAVALSGLDREVVTVGGIRMGLMTLLLRTVIHAHLVAVLARSHGNPKIFAQFKVRFVVAPIILGAVMMASEWALAAVLVITTFWDVYHSSMQTFGLGRIYDSLRGNAADAGRAWDIGFNHSIYIIPHLVGPLLPALLGMFSTFNQFGYTHFDGFPALVMNGMNVLRPVLLWAGGIFFLGYLGAYWRLVQRGYQLSSQKLLLMFTTAVAAIAAAGFDVVGQGLLVLNLFHAIQYLALVWWVEGGRLSARLRLDGSSGKRAAAAVILLALVLVYGFLFGAFPEFTGVPAISRVVLVVCNLISLLHFWYDGFVWSVRKKEATT